MKLVIRKATINDLHKVQALNLELFKKEHKEYDPLLNLEWTLGKEGTKYYKDRIKKDDGCVLVAEVDGEIIGYLCGGMVKVEAYRKMPLVAELENTLVLEKFRSKGIGQKLFNGFLEWCTNMHVGKIRVEASAQNERAIKFYRKNSFIDYMLVLELDA